MPTAAEDPLIFYPAYCFSASPTYNAWVKLTAAGVHALRSRRGFEGQGLYFYLNHPVQWVQVTGLVVDFDEYNDLYWLFHIDDGSGALVEVVLPRKKVQKAALAKPGELITLVPQPAVGVSALGNEVDVGQIEIGVTVKVKGGIREFRNIKQIALERLFYLKDTSAEMQAWEASLTQYGSTLSKPWALSQAQERGLKDRAQGKVARRERRRQALRDAGEPAQPSKSTGSKSEEKDREQGKRKVPTSFAI